MTHPHNHLFMHYNVAYKNKLNFIFFYFFFIILLTFIVKKK